MVSYDSRDPEFDYLFKILIIGDAGVGKTAILQRFSQQYFATDYVATIGVDFQIRTLDVNEKRCKLQVWDTAGQDRFKCVVSSFYRGAHGVMICFDITDSETFRNVENWLSEVKRYCPDETPVFLVGTKADLQNRRMVSYATIKAFAEAKNLRYLETSAKSNTNIDAAFENFTGQLVEHTAANERLYKKPATPKPPTIDPRLKPVHPNSGTGCFGTNTCSI